MAAGGGIGGGQTQEGFPQAGQALLPGHICAATAREFRPGASRKGPVG